MVVPENPIYWNWIYHLVSGLILWQLKKNIASVSLGVATVAIYCHWAPCPCHDPCHQDHKHHAQHHGPGVLCVMCLVFVSLVKVNIVDICWCSKNTPKLKPRYCNSHVLMKKGTFPSQWELAHLLSMECVCTGRLLGCFVFSCDSCGNWDTVLLKPCHNWGHLWERCRNKTYLTMWKHSPIWTNAWKQGNSRTILKYKIFLITSYTLGAIVG